MALTEKRKGEIEVQLLEVIEDEQATDAFLEALTEEEAAYAGEFAVSSVASLPLAHIAASLS